MVPSVQGEYTITPWSWNQYNHMDSPIYMRNATMLSYSGFDNRHAMPELL